VQFPWNWQFFVLFVFFVVASSAMGLQPPRPAQNSNNEEQQHRADECNENGSGESADRHRHVKRAEQPATYKCSANTDDDVTDQSEPCAAHHERGEESGNESDDQPGEEVHVFHPEDEGLGDGLPMKSNLPRFGVEVSYIAPPDFESLRQQVFDRFAGQTLYPSRLWLLILTY